MITHKHINATIKTLLGVFMIGIAAFTVAKLYDSQTHYTCSNNGLAVVAGPGDNLWDIAQTYCTGDTRAAMQDLVNIYGSSLNPGAIINLRSSN